MEPLLTPEEIKQRAKLVGLSLPDLCREAGIALSTWYRWRAGQHSPNIENYQRLVAIVTEREPVANAAPPPGVELAAAPASNAKPPSGESGVIPDLVVVGGGRVRFVELKDSLDAGVSGRLLRNMCREAGIPFSTFYRWRAGQHSPKISIYQRLVDVPEREPAA